MFLIRQPAMQRGNLRLVAFGTNIPKNVRSNTE